MKRSKENILEGVSKSCLKARIVDNNTLSIDYQDGSKAIRLYDTDIITIMEDGKVILNSGGWRTATTKARINSDLNPYWPSIALCSDHGIWHVYKGAYRVCRFEDGMSITKDGIVKGGSPITDGKADRIFKRKVKKYAELCVSSIPLSLPGPGDCWFCSMQVKDGKSLGETMGDTEHLLSHIDEGYVVPSLVYTALKKAGAEWIYFAEVSGHLHMGGSVLKTIKRFVYRFILRQFGYSV